MTAASVISGAPLNAIAHQKCAGIIGVLPEAGQSKDLPIQRWINDGLTDAYEADFPRG